MFLLLQIIQIELRILAHVSGDKVLVSAFKNKEDIHQKTASEVFGTPLEQVTKEQRRAAKAINFGIIYGQTDYGLSRELDITRQEAQAYIDLYFERYKGVKNWTEAQIKEARVKGYVTTLLGRRRYLKDINSKNFNLRSFAERAAVNSTLQGTAADIIKLAMLKIQSVIAEKNYQSKMILQIHDELVFEVPPRESAKLIADIRENMENAYPLTVPLTVDVKAGFNLYEMEKI
jgi:DNA polymerase-1